MPSGSANITHLNSGSGSGTHLPHDSSRLKVLFLTHAFPRHDGDLPGSFILRLASALQAIGVDIRVVAPASPGSSSSDVIDGIPVERFRYAPRKYETLAYTGTMAQEVSALWSARFAMVGFLGANFTSTVRARRHFEPALIHAHWWFPAGLVGSWVSKLANVPLVTTSHGSDVRLARTHSVLKPLARHVLQRSNAVTTVSSWLAREMHEFDDHLSPTVAPMPVETHLFTPGAPGEREPQRILLVGRMNPQKGVAYAIRALAQMRTRAVLDIIGTGPELEQYRSLAQSLQLADRVVFHGDVAHATLPQRYRKASVLVMPSIEEGLGLVAVESLLCETPVVAFNSGGIPDVVHHGQTGLLVPPTDVPALAAALDELLEKPSYAATLGEAGRLYALANFAPESVARRYLEIYQRVLHPQAA